MKFKALFLALATLAAGAAAPAQKVDKSKLPRMAILEFKSAPDAWYGWHFGGWGNHMGTISNQLRDLFTTAIMENGQGKVRMVERERLDEIRGELQFQQSGEVDVNTVQKIGKLLGVKYVMTGKVTRFAYKEGGFSSGWGVGALVGKVTGNSTAGAVAGDVNIKKATFSGRLDCRLIEVETGEILWSGKDEAKTGETTVKVAGTGAEVQYDEELVNKVFEPIVDRMAPKIVAGITKANAESPDAAN